MKKMTLIAIKKDGLSEVQVVVDGKPYTYHIGSQYAVDEFLGHYNRGSYGKAITVLNKHNEGGTK